MAVTKPNPMRLAYWAIAGACIGATIFFVPFLPLPHIQVSAAGRWASAWANRLRLGMILVPAVTGLLLWYVADRRFRKGFADGIWSEAELESVLTMLRSSAWVWLFSVLSTIAILLVSFDEARHGIFLCAVTFPMNVVTSLRRLLSPRVEKKGGLGDWRNFKRLQSEHWGEARHEGQLPS
jgi:hypothetical protein